MLMTYEDVTSSPIGHQAEEWTKELLDRLKKVPTPSGRKRHLTGHFSFDFISSTKDKELYPLECNARVHTAVILLPISEIASCYDHSIDCGASTSTVLRPISGTLPRSWIYNDLIMRYLPLIIPFPSLLSLIHPSLLACSIDTYTERELRPYEDPWILRVDPTLVADDWAPFLVLWHVYWPELLLRRWWQGKKWTRVSRPVEAELPEQFREYRAELSSAQCQYG